MAGKKDGNGGFFKILKRINKGELKMRKYILWSDPGHRENICKKINAFYPDIEIVDCASDAGSVKKLYRSSKAGGVILSSALSGRFPGTTLSEMLDELLNAEINDVFLIPVTLLNTPLQVMKDNDLGGDFLERSDKFSEPIVIKFMTSDGCNLNCAGCTHFSPLISKPHMLTPDEVLRDCAQLKKVFRYVRSIEFLGGEPFINQDIPGLINAARGIFPYSHVAILTNGILIPELNDKTLSSIRDNNVKVVISRYLPTDKRAYAIEEVLNKWNIRYDISEKIEYFRMQYNTRGDKDAQQNFKECPDHLCHTIKDGKLGGCYYATMGNIGNEYFGVSIPYEEALYDIYDPKWTGSELFWKLNKATGLCAYCNSVVGSPMMPWHVSSRGKEMVEEWFYDDIAPVKDEIQTLHCAFYGGGSVCRWVLRAWAQRGFRPECIIDKRAADDFCELNGIPVIPPDKIKEFDEDMVYVISCHEQEGVKEILRGFDIQSERVFDGRDQDEDHMAHMLSMIGNNSCEGL